MSRASVPLLVAAALLCSAAPVNAQSFPEGPGRNILETQCSTCHTPDIVRTPHRSADEWRDVVLAMNDLGAKVTEEQFPVLVDYLAKNFSRSASSTSDASSSPVSQPATSKAASGPEAAPRNSSTLTPRSNEAADVVKRLPEAKVSILDGILQAERGNGPAISAKFEVEDGKLLLSVYNAKQGMGLGAEFNVLTELKGDATTPKWRPMLQAFADKAHIGRA